MVARWSKILPPIILAGIVLVFFSPYLDSRNIPYVGDFTGSDLIELNLPFRFLVAQSFRQGTVPLWTNLIANGFPLLAEGQAGIFYPFNFLIFTWLSFATGVNISLMVNFFLGSLFCYWYCRSLKISLPGSLLAAVAFGFSGFFVFRIKHLNYINAAVWLPLQYYLIEKYFTFRRKSLVVIALSLIFAVQFYAGSPPIFYVAVIASLIYFGLKIFFQHPDEFKKPAIKMIGPWLIIGVVTLGLVAVQLLPTFFYSTLSGRSLSTTYSQVIGFPYPASSLLTFVSPFALGNPAQDTYPKDLSRFGVFWENNNYFGLLPLLFAFIAIFFLTPKRAMVKILTVLILIAFLFSFGDFSPLFIIFWHAVPGLTLFRFHMRFMLVALLALATLAGFGFDFCWQKIKNLLQQTKYFRRATLLGNVLIPVLVILITVIDLFFISVAYWGVLDSEAYLAEPQSVSFLNKDQDHFRIYSVAWPQAWHAVNYLAGGWQNNLSLQIAHRGLLAPNANIFWGISSAQDRASLEGGLLDQETQQFSQILLTQGFISDEADSLVLKAPDQTLKILGLQNVKYLLSFMSLVNDRLELVKEIRADFLPGLKIYRNPWYLPRAFGVFQVKSEAGNQAVLAKIFSNDFDPASQIVLDQPSDLIINGSPEAIVEMIEEKAAKLSLEVNFSDDGYLFLSQADIPGWQAHVDNQRTKILAANYAFSAVQVPAGRHRVTFEFKPLPYFVGAWLTSITLLGVLTYIIFYLIILAKLKRNF